MDTKSKMERSRNMAAIGSRNTRPEVLLRRALWHRGLRFFTPAGWATLTGKRLPGSPDVLFPAPKLALFVDGCFWHGCPLHYSAPDDNGDYWRSKLARNTQRDRLVDQQLQEAGWRVVRVWEHELCKGGHEPVASAIKELLTGDTGATHWR